MLTTLPIKTVEIFAANFPLLKSIVDLCNCKANKLPFLISTQYYFVWVETAIDKVLYFQDNTPYCKETPI